jgi:hypothetical protein
MIVSNFYSFLLMCIFVEFDFLKFHDWCSFKCIYIFSFVWVLFVCIFLIYLWCYCVIFTHDSFNYYFRMCGFITFLSTPNGSEFSMFIFSLGKNYSSYLEILFACFIVAVFSCNLGKVFYIMCILFCDCVMVALNSDPFFCFVYIHCYGYLCELNANL